MKKYNLFPWVLAQCTKSVNREYRPNTSCPHGDLFSVTSRVFPSPQRKISRKRPACRKKEHEKKRSRFHRKILCKETHTGRKNNKIGQKHKLPKKPKKCIKQTKDRKKFTLQSPRRQSLPQSTRPRFPQVHNIPQEFLRDTADGRILRSKNHRQEPALS